MEDQEIPNVVDFMGELERNKARVAIDLANDAIEKLLELEERIATLCDKLEVMQSEYWEFKVLIHRITKQINIEP